MDQPTNNGNSPVRIWQRREFVNSLMIGVGGSALLMTPGITFGQQQPAMTIQQVIDLIISTVPGAPFKNTVDTVKSGDASQQVKGIVTTMFSTIDVIEKAAKAGANFIIAHEPTFYNHADATAWLENDPVYRYKQELLKKYKIVVWRCHDYIHTHQPDGVLMGVLTALGWEKNYDAADLHLVTVTPTTLQKIIEICKTKLSIEHLKYIGDPSQQCSRITLMPGAAGGTRQIEALQKHKPDLLIVGEVNEWETSEYVRDARAMGSPLTLIVLGHIVSEEPGLQWMKTWLEPQLPGIPITHVESKEAFSWG